MATGKGEYKTLRQINSKLFHLDKPKAVAYRLLQPKGRSQPCDILLDSKHKKYYLAIEVKKKENRHALSFNNDFSVLSNGEHQLDRMYEFCQASGRTGYIFLYTREGKGKNGNFTRYIFALKDLYKLYRKGYKSLLAKHFEKFDCTEKLEKDGVI